MEHLIDSIAQTDSVVVALERASAYARSLGVERLTFHIAPPQVSQIGRNVYIAEFGHDPEWIRAYRNHALRQHDPFPDHIMRLGRATSYADALEQLSLDEDQQAFVRWLRDEGQFDMVGIPAYGPFDFDSFTALKFGDDAPADLTRTLEQMIVVIEIVNRRVAQLLETRTAAAIALSKRESDVLNWMGRSKSNADIATILGISTGTVDTYVRRLYAKLGANDRIAAALKGVRLGLIRF
jgi:DNA-binding CsgD family transcriptional regulator